MRGKILKPEEQVYNYTEELQRFFISSMISYPEIFTRCRTILKVDYWDRILRPPIKYILEFSDTRNTLPTTEMIKAYTGQSFDKYDNYNESIIKEILEQIEGFCRHKSFDLLALEMPDLIKAGLYGTIEVRARENIQITLQKDLGTSFFSNIQERLLQLKDKSSLVSTGWKALDDKLMGGSSLGGLLLFAGQPGAGKSLILQNIALNWVFEGKDVVYITLELKEPLVDLRLCAMITDTSTKQVIANTDETAMKIVTQYKSKKLGDLTVKKFPEGGTTTNHIRAYLKEYEIQNGKKPDALVVDYIDLLYPNDSRINISDAFLKDKCVSEELRALSGDYDFRCASASQLNRSSFGDEFNNGNFDMSNIAGGISKLNTADDACYIWATPDMKQKGEFELILIKTRTSSGTGSRVYLKYNPVTMRITDYADGEREGKKGPKPTSEVAKDAREVMKSSNKAKASQQKNSGNDDDDGDNRVNNLQRFTKR